MSGEQTEAGYGTFVEGWRRFISPQCSLSWRHHLIVDIMSPSR